MTREQAKKLLENPLFKAFSEGKVIQQRYRNEWVDDIQMFHPNLFLNPEVELRVKPTAQKEEVEG